MRTSPIICLALCLVTALALGQSAPGGPAKTGGSAPASAARADSSAPAGPAEASSQAPVGGSAPQAADSFPQAQIANGLISARLYLPDTASGYYRGTRFDWSGVMPDLDYKGHHYSGQWFAKYAPTIHDAIMGPVESFAPLGYDKAKPGGHFIAIGIGALTRIDEKPYAPFRYYPIVNPGKWRVKTGSSKAVFVQTLSDSGYAYAYTKTVRLLKGKAILVLEHKLKNTGQKTIETDVYDHNLFPIDHQPTGPGLVVSFAFAPGAAEERRIQTAQEATGRADAAQASGRPAAGLPGPVALIKDSQIVFLRRPVNKEDAYCVLSGYGDSPKDYDIRIENRNTGAGMRITGDRPLSRLVFWASPTTACPEAYVHIRVAPGETFSWTIAYQLYDTSTLINKP